MSNGTDSTGSEMSDGGYWSCDHGNSSPAPSPPDAEADRTPPVDDGLDMEMDQVLFDEPAPRKRKVNTSFWFFEVKYTAGDFKKKNVFVGLNCIPTCFISFRTR